MLEVLQREIGGPAGQRHGRRSDRHPVVLPIDGGQRRRPRLHLHHRPGAGPARHPHGGGRPDPLRRKGFTIDVDSPEEFRRAIADTLDHPEAHRPDVDLARRYAHLFFFEAPVRSPGVEEHVQGLVRLTTTSLEDLAPGADPDIDRICHAILHGNDGSRPPPRPDPPSRRPLVLRADGGGGVGAGHVGRCIVLAEAWRRAGGDAHLVLTPTAAAHAEQMQTTVPVALIDVEPGSPRTRRPPPRRARAPG